MWYEDSNFSFMALEGPGYLFSSQHKTAGCMQHKVNLHLRLCHAYCSKHCFRILNINVSGKREPEETHYFLPMYHTDYTTVAFSLDRPHYHLAFQQQHPLLHQWYEERN